MSERKSTCPYFSVVIPLYNKENEIKRAIDSVLNQIFQDFELIIVNDESTDNSLSVVEAIQDTRIKIISQKNQGEYGARNTGILNSTAPYIAFLDGDDEWKPEYLETIRSLIEKYPDAGLYGTARLRVSDKNQQKSIVYGFNEGDEGIVDMPLYAFVKTRAGPISCSSAVVPRTVFNELGLFRPYSGAGGDWAMWTLIMLHYPLAYSAKLLSQINLIGENRLSCIPKNMQLHEHPVVTLINSLPKDTIQKYKYKEHIPLLMDFANISLAQNWAETGGAGKDIREIICEVNNKSEFKKEIVYYTVLAYTPLRFRDLVGGCARWLNRYM